MDNINEKVKENLMYNARRLSADGENRDGEDGLIVKSLEDVLHDSMIPYTEHVVLDRALPRVEDGLKPVQRRILYSMLELGVTPDKPYRKSARIVGDCMGKYHPHGDSSVYDAMVRMSQNFSMSATLVDGHGNFGSVDGDCAAAMRYTEAKLQPLAMELLRDIDKNTIRWTLNFDDSLKEPDILPGRFPNLLVNGAYGIAVGLATNIPPHNLGEVINGVCAYIDKKIPVEEMMKYIPAPDFPTGGLITAGDELLNAYKTGKGKIIIRAKVHLESKGDRRDLVITEIPYQVNKSALLQKIAELREDGKNCLAFISDIRDESDRNGMRAVLRLKKEADPKEILEYLYKSTNLQVSFGINMVAIANGKPQQMGLIDIIDYYVNYQRDVIYKRTKFDLDQAKDREHIVAGLLIAIKNIDDVVKIIRSSSNTNEAKQRLKEKFLLSEKQVQAILDMRLARLVNLEVGKLESELENLKQLIKKLTEICGNKSLQFEIVKSELLEIKRKYAVDRRSKIISTLDIQSLDDCDDGVSRKAILAISVNDLVKLVSIKNSNMSQKDVSENSTESNIHKIALEVDVKNKILFLLSSGSCVCLDASKIPDAKWREKGVSLKSFDNSIPKNDSIISAVEVTDSIAEKKLIFVSKKGMIKISNASEYLINRVLFQAIKLKENDEIIYAGVDDENSTVFMVSKSAMALNALIDDVPTQGRISCGVIGMNLDDNDFLIYAKQNHSENNIVVITDKGYVKKVNICEFEPSLRNRKGLRITNLTPTNGSCLLYAGDDQEHTSICVETQDEKFNELFPTSILTEARFSKGVQKFNEKIKQIYRMEK